MPCGNRPLCRCLRTTSPRRPSFVSRACLKLCFALLSLIVSIGAIFCGVSLLALTAVRVERLLVLTLRIRYRQVVTLRRVQFLVAAFWLRCFPISFMLQHNPQIAASTAILVAILCLVISTFCYSKIHLTLARSDRQAQVQDRGNPGQTNRGGIPINLARYKKTVSRALWLQMTLLTCYLPYSIVGALTHVAALDAPSCLGL